MSLRLETVSLRAGDKALISDVSVELERGSIDLLLGPALAGKTMLMRLMAGLDQPTTGRVLIDRHWTVELEPGWSLFAMHPVNRIDLSFSLLSRLVDGDRFHDIGILFPAIWTDPSFEGVLPRGTPCRAVFPYSMRDNVDRVHDIRR